MSTTQKYQRRSEADWQALVGEFYNGKLTATQFCKQHHLSVSSFYQWRNRFTEESSRKLTESPESSFIDLADIAGSTGRWSIVLRLGHGVELTLSQQ